jgi:hypothetical protein
LGVSHLAENERPTEQARAVAGGGAGVAIQHQNVFEPAEG